MVSTRGIYTKALYGTFAVILLLQLYTLPFPPIPLSRTTRYSSSGLAGLGVLGLFAFQTSYNRVLGHHAWCTWGAHYQGLSLGCTIRVGYCAHTLTDFIRIFIARN